MRSLLAAARARAWIVALGCTSACFAACVDVTTGEEEAPPASGCGDGIRDPDTEACDLPGGNSDERGSCTTSCAFAVCGDGLRREEEACDLGTGVNSNTGACTEACELPVCGDGFIQPQLDEECDLGPENGGLLCTVDCSLPPAVCGDGSLQEGEECDLGDGNGGAQCSAACTIPACGNGRIDADEACDQGPGISSRSASCTASCELPLCGDGLRSPKEDCDGDVPDCTAACTAPSCGVAGVFLGMHQTFARMRDGRLIGAGNDVDGQLGRASPGTTDGVPVEIAGEPLWRMASGAGGGAGITFDGRLLTWGANGWGQLGLGDVAAHDGRVEPMPGTRFSDVSAGWEHFLALDVEGNVWSWGRDDRGQAGDGPGSVLPSCCAPTPIRLLPGERWVGVFAGVHQSFIVRSDGALYAFGSDEKTQLGDGAAASCEPGQNLRQSPVLIRGAPAPRELAAAADTTFLLDVEGALWVAGSGPRVDGVETLYCQFQPLPVPERNGAPLRFVAIEAGEYQLLALDDLGEVWGFGSNAQGQLGMGEQQGGFELAPVPLPAGAGPAVAIQGSWRHSAVLLADGQLLVTGWNNDGMLGQPPPLAGTTMLGPFPVCP